ncbi:MAG: hypothetical protein AAF490_31230 [Chloroflexota bacterium]
MNNPDSAPSFGIEVNIPIQDIQTEWSRCSMLANYIAEYVAFEYEHREWAENLLSTISNELLETAVYLAPDISDLELKINKNDSAFMVTMTHLVKDPLLTHYETFIHALDSDQKQDIYINWLTQSKEEAPYFNQLGLCILTNDFDAQLQIQNESNNRVETILHLPIKEL